MTTLQNFRAYGKDGTNGPLQSDKILVKGILMGHVRTQKKVLTEAEAVASARPLLYPVHCPYHGQKLLGAASSCQSGSPKILLPSWFLQHQLPMQAPSPTSAFTYLAFEIVLR
jgi:hypothetical protein